MPIIYQIILVFAVFVLSAIVVIQRAHIKLYEEQEKNLKRWNEECWKCTKEIIDKQDSLIMDMFKNKYSHKNDNAE